MEKIINLRGKKEIKSIKTHEHIGRIPEATFTIEFDDKEKLIIDLSLLGQITEKVSGELDEIEKKLTKKMALGLMASFMAMGGDKKDIKDLFKNL